MLLTALLTFSAILFFESRVESFAPQLKLFAESKIEGAFDGRIKLSIGSLDGGIIHPFTVNDCRITDEKGSPIIPSLEIKSIRSNYRIWDALKIFSKEPYIDVKFAANSKDVFGFLRIEGDIKNAKLTGYINIFGDERINLAGTVKERVFEAELKSHFGSVKARGMLAEDNTLTANLKISHLKIKGFDITCDAVLRNKFISETAKAQRGHLEGDLETKNLIVNYGPFLDIKSSYKISKGLLTVSNLEIGKNFKLYGKLYLNEPYNTDMVMTVDNANLSQILSMFGIQEAIRLSGIMNGAFRLKGPAGKSRLDAKMEIRQGELAGVDFEFLTASLKGEGPIIRIEESRVTRTSGYFVLAGEIDLNKAGKGNVFDGIKIASSDAAINWDHLDVKNMRDMQEVRMEKKVSEDVNFGFKSFSSDKKIDEGLNPADEFELGYKLHPNDSLKVRIGQEKDFFGYEHEDKF